MGSIFFAGSLQAEAWLFVSHAVLDELRFAFQLTDLTSAEADRCVESLLEEETSFKMFRNV